MEVTCEHRYPSSRSQATAASGLGLPPQTQCDFDTIEPFPLALEEDHGRWKHLYVAKQNFNVLMLRINTESIWRDYDVSVNDDAQLALGNLF